MKPVLMAAAIMFMLSFALKAHGDELPKCSQSRGQDCIIDYDDKYNGCTYQQPKASYWDEERCNKVYQHCMPNVKAGMYTDGPFITCPLGHPTNPK